MSNEIVIVSAARTPVKGDIIVSDGRGHQVGPARFRIRRGRRHRQR